MNDLKKLILRIQYLKPIPQVAGQILELAEQPESRLTDIADLIALDPLITANLLKTCNSAYYGLKRKIDSVKDAVMILGLDAVVEMTLLKMSAENLMGQQEGYGLREGELWRHSVACALFAKTLAKRKGIPDKNLIYTAALLKDIGKVLLDRYVADAAQQIQELVTSRNISFLEAEKKIIGIDHAELGGLVAEAWGFSDRLTGMIAGHHLADPEIRKDMSTLVVYMADTTCMMLGIGVGEDGLAYRFHEEALDRLHLSDSELQQWIIECGEMVKKVDQLIDIT